MDPGKPLLRRTCTSCRKWFHSKPSAVTTQKTCSAACRAVRRAMLARHRRERGLQESRVAERERQRACRERRRKGEKVVTRRVRSRAPLPPEVAAIRAEILARVDHAARLSRATLDRQLRGILGVMGPLLDQAGP
jgi:hypothetical protein